MLAPSAAWVNSVRSEIPHTKQPCGIAREHEGELSAAQSLGAGIISLEELMLGCIQLVLGCVEQCCFFAMGCNLEPPPPLQHNGNAHRGSDHDDGRGRPPVRDDDCEDGNAHAGKDRMPLGARLRLHVFTLTPPGHQGLTPWIRFGNRPVMNEPPISPPPWPRKMPPTTISRGPRPPAMRRSISTTSVAIELDQPLVADPEVMRDLVEHDVPDLAA
jgi:hypothetical protein